MSRGPNIQQIQELQVSLVTRRTAMERLGEIHKLLKEKEKLEETVREENTKIFMLLQDMDVKSDGNAGWEGRILMFLNEMHRLAQR